MLQKAETPTHPHTQCWTSKDLHRLSEILHCQHTFFSRLALHIPYIFSFFSFFFIHFHPHPFICKFILLQLYPLCLPSAHYLFSFPLFPQTVSVMATPTAAVTSTTWTLSRVWAVSTTHVAKTASTAAWASTGIPQLNWMTRVCVWVRALCSTIILFSFVKLLEAEEELSAYVLAECLILIEVELF